MITLEQSKVGMADKVDQAIVDEFRRGSYLLDKLIFDNAVSPGTGGSTLTYGYVKLDTPATAAFRELNTEYTSNEATRKQMTTNLKIFGGEFSLDRVIINTSGAVNELDFQLQQKIKAATNLFHYTVINGDSGSNELEFDGLDVLLADSSTNVVPTDAIDISDTTALDANYNEFLDAVDDFVATMDGKPQMFLMNSKLKTKMKGGARRAGYYSRTEDAFGQSVDNWDGIPLIDLEEFYDADSATTTPCVPINADGTTTLYAVQIGIDAFHAVSPTGDKVISSCLPDLTKPGVIKKGDVEMVAAVALKNTKKAGKLSNIKVQAASE